MKYVSLILKKIFRDLRQGWLSFGACAAMLALSVSLFLAFFSAAYSLESSTDATYQKLKFLDFTLLVDNVSQSGVSGIRAIPGVEAATGRNSLTERTRILLDPPTVPPSRSQAVDGQLTGLPHDARPDVNDVFVEQGRYLSQARGEALLERRFAQHHGYQPGDTLRVEVQGAERRFRIVGLVSSPEFVWMVNNRFDPRPLEKRYGVVFVSDTEAFSAAGGAYINEIHVRVAPTVSRSQVVAEAEHRLGSSLRSATVLREDQPSHSLVLRDRKAFQGLAVFFPAVFLSLSSITLFSTLWQLVSRQRRQIGILMSQGCSSKQLMSQYLLLGLVVGVVGALLGILAGLPLGALCTRFYTGILGLPFVEQRLPLISVLFIVALALALSLAAAWTATYRILRMDPIRAIRMEFQEGWAPRQSNVFDSLLPTRLRFALRNLARNPGRTLLSVLGIAVSVAQIVMTLALFDSQKETLSYYFRNVHRYDFEVSLKNIMGATSLPHIASWPEVESVETCLRRSAVLTFEGRELHTNVWGVAPEGELFRLFDRQRERVTVNGEPLLFLGPVQLARLGAKPGDQVQLSLHRPQPDAPSFRFTIAHPLHEPLAHPPKLSIRQLQDVSAKSEYAPEGGVNVMLVRARDGQQQALADKLAREDSVANVSSPGQMQDEVKELLRMFNAYKSLVLAFTAIFALVVLLGTTTMNVMERSREFATLSCLGVSDLNLASLLLLETTLLWLLGLALGLPAGLALGTEMMNSFQSQLLHLDLSLSLETVALTAVLSLAICLLALLNGLLRLRSLPLTAATQDRFD